MLTRIVLAAPNRVNRNHGSCCQRIWKAASVALVLLELGVFERATSAALRGNFLAAPGYLLKLRFSPTGEGILKIHS